MDRVTQSDGEERLLTEKQRAVLDLLIEHKTSKQIARELEISPYTVDQRITAARRKLGVATRNELAAAYRGVRGISQRSVYQSSHVEVSNLQAEQGGGTADEHRPHKEGPFSKRENETEEQVEIYRVGPEIFDGPNGIWFRLGAIGMTTIMLLLVVLGGLATFGQLSDLMM